MNLAISGSLRRSSVNSAALRAARAAAARAVASRSTQRAALPPFDRDLEAGPRSGAPLPGTCDLLAVLLAVPEYAFASGAFKNALDWTSAAAPLYRKPVALLTCADRPRRAGPRGARARADRARCATSPHSAGHPAGHRPGGEIGDPTI